MTPFRTRLAALGTAAALALGSLAPAPALAQTSNDDLGRLVAGAVGLAALGVILSNRSSGSSKAQAGPPAHAGHRHAAPRHAAPRHAAPRHAGPRHAAPPRHVAPPRAGTPQRNPRHQPLALPGRCATEVSQGRQRDQLYRANCLNNAGVNLRRLPQSCAVSLRTNRGVQTAYRASCLQRAGVIAPGRGRHW